MVARLLRLCFMADRFLGNSGGSGVRLGRWRGKKMIVVLSVMGLILSMIQRKDSL